MPRIYLERRDMTDELRRLFDLLDPDAPLGSGGGEYAPPVDVMESAAAYEIAVDLPGVLPDQISVVFSRGSLLVAGTKRPAVCGHSNATFHLAERTFGRFARVIRLAGAIDAGRARATLQGGELRIVVPRIEERRGREIRLTIETA